MTGNEIAKKIKSGKGKLYTMIAVGENGFYLPIEKAELIKLMERHGDTETGMQITQAYDRTYFEEQRDI
jgi:hypothetical protein